MRQDRKKKKQKYTHQTNTRKCELVFITLPCTLHQLPEKTPKTPNFKLTLELSISTVHSSPSNLFKDTLFLLLTLALSFTAATLLFSLSRVKENNSSHLPFFLLQWLCLSRKQQAVVRTR